MASVATGATFLNNPMTIFFDHLMNGFVNRAMAETTGINPRRYIYIQQPGAPPRWTFDLFLTPYEKKNFVSNPMVATKYIASGGRYTDSTYSTFNYKGINLPHMWQFSVPKAGGTMRPMTDLIDSLFAIQGINTGNAGHPGSQTLHMKPSGAIRTITALPSDYSSNPMSAINLSTSSYQFNSLNGKSSVTVSSAGRNMLETLLNPFIGKAPSNFLQKFSRLESSINTSIEALDQLATQQHPLAKALNDDRSGAENLIRTGFPGLGDTWNQLLGKYQDLIRRAIDPAQRLEGINELPIGITGTRNKEYDLADNANTVTTADLRNLIVDSTVINLMAEHFAVAEYVILNDLSRSVSLFIGNFINLSSDGNTKPNGVFDEHNTGRMVSLYLNSMFNRAFAACLLEFIDQLKSADIFSETVIDVAAEFNRSPRKNGTGSDHGWQGASTVLYSGAYSGPLIIGNLRADPGGTYQGTWGYGAAIPELNNHQLKPSHMAATIASLLRTPSPVTSATSLVQLQGSQLRSLIGKTKIT